MRRLHNWPTGPPSFRWHNRGEFGSHHHPTKILLESLTSKKQNVSHLCVFSVKCWAKIPTVHGVQVTGESKLQLSVDFWDMQGAMVTIRFRTLPLIVFSCLVILSLRKVS